MKNKHRIDISVALVFFSRPDVLEKTFDAIRKARPSKLFLIQDGQRENNENDLLNINACKKIVEDVDWDCEVHKNYSDENLGCGMRIYSGISWAFQYVDRLAIIEDDCVPSLEFFKFTKEMLDRYADDQRVDMISGMNNLEIWNKTPYSYFFATTGSIWGWATWKRVWDTVDFDLNFIEDEDDMRLLKKKIQPKRLSKKVLSTSKSHYLKLKKGERLTSWSNQRGINMLLHSGLIIIPKKNLISNIGLTNDSVHASNSLKKIPKKLQRVFFLKTHKLDNPLKHPKYIIEDIDFNNELNRLMNPPLHLAILRRFEGILRRIIFK